MMSKHLRPATLRDVAEACGVSQATASKALSPHSDRCDVSAETRERVRAAARSLGFERDRSASLRARRRWNNIGLAWGREAPRGDGIYSELFETAARTLKPWGYHLLFTPIEDAEDWRRMQIAQRLDGVLAVESLPMAVLKRIETEEYPAVTLNLYDGGGLRGFLPDDRGGAAAVARHLAELGHRRAVYVPRKAWATHASDDVRHAGASSCPELAVETLEPTAAVQRCQDGGASAIIAYSQSEAVRVLAVVRERGLRVPQAFSLVACSDVTWLQHLDPPLTAVAIPIAEMAAQAASLLVDLIEGKTPDAGVVLVPERLVERASTRRI
jgi:LacI family transcriptional regulator